MLLTYRTSIIYAISSNLLKYMYIIKVDIVKLHFMVYVYEFRWVIVIDLIVNALFLKYYSFHGNGMFQHYIFLPKDKENYNAFYPLCFFMTQSPL